MSETTVHLHTEFSIGEVDPRIFGGFLEHMGRAVYGGVYQPDSPHADSDGWRADVLEALRGLEMSQVRYPGGNFASGYHWEDGVGPRDARPTVRELAWQSIEPNSVGTDEFMALANQMGWEPMLCTNLGTGTPEEARNWVEYCNSPEGTLYADKRVAAGHREPHDVKLWCLGNEMDGPWQLGHVPAAQYAIRAQQAGKMMKDVDPSIELILCGTSNPLLGTYLEWDRESLEYVGGLADYVSLHRYVGIGEQNTPDFLAIPNSIDQQIEEVDAACRFVQGKRKSQKRAWLCFDEWNVWYKTMKPGSKHMQGGGKFAPPLIEEVYDLRDALVVAGFLHSFVRHADVLKIANIAQIVNIIAPILTRDDSLLVQSIYWPFAMFSRRRKGVSLAPRVRGARYDSDRYGDTDVIDASAILNGDTLAVFLTNRGETPARVTLDLADRSFQGGVDAECLTGPDPLSAKSWEDPSIITPRAFTGFQFDGGKAEMELPPYSFLAASLALK
ncbi:MAG: alpha-L-arabinofuranosidase C-terminal domain-containing protein [Myxococcota bacterium]|nr:alpha-L-arabinofuranosidase C-terminal domain-containing protein [Myxococcota bacterium]